MIPYFIVRGIHGTGKSTLARIATHIKRIEPEDVVLSCAEIENLSSHDIRVLKYRANFNTAMNLLLAGESFIWIQPWRKFDRIYWTMDKLQNACPDGTDLLPVIITIRTNCLISYYRYINREKTLGKKISFPNYYKNYVRTFEFGPNPLAHTYTISNNNLRYAKRKFQNILISYLGDKFN